MMTIVLPVAALLALIGFSMAFCQTTLRRWLGHPAPPRSSGEDEDPLAYALRIAGVMFMAFGVVIGMMFTVVHLAA